MQANWYNGKTARAHPVTVSVSTGELIVRHHQSPPPDQADAGAAGTTADIPDELHYPVADVQWPERTESGSRVLLLPDGSSLQAQPGENWSALAQQAGVQETTIVKWQQSTRMMLVALVLVFATAVAGYFWGVPVIARTALAFVPEWVDEKIGASALETFGSRMLEDSTLDEKQKAEITAQFEAMVQDYYRFGDSGGTPGYQLSFHRSKVGANAFALPGGYIIMTDELVRMADGNTDMVLGVLAHELAHVTERHGMKMLSRTLLIGTIMAVVLGDYGDLVATVPLVLGQTAYSRDFEREADEHAIQMLLNAGKSPAVMAEFFRLLEDIHTPPTTGKKDGDGASDGKDEDDSGLPSLGVLISSHPATEERIRRFEEAARTGR